MRVPKGYAGYTRHNYFVNKDFAEKTARELRKAKVKVKIRYSDPHYEVWIK